MAIYESALNNRDETRIHVLVLQMLAAFSVFHYQYKKQKQAKTQELISWRRGTSATMIVPPHELKRMRYAYKLTKH